MRKSTEIEFDVYEQFTKTTLLYLWRRNKNGVEQDEDQQGTWQAEVLRPSREHHERNVCLPYEKTALGAALLFCPVASIAVQTGGWNVDPTFQGTTTLSEGRWRACRGVCSRVKK